MSSLTVNYLGIPMASPVIGASGTVGYGLELADYIDMKKIGALSGKGLAPTPWKGNEGVRVAETTSGMLNCIGLENPGAPWFIEHYLPEVRKLPTAFIANMVGKSVEEYAECARMLTVPGISALEVNISCPNVKEGGAAFGTDPAQAAAVTRAVKDATTLPVIVKLSPNVTDIVSIAKAVEDAGADAPPARRDVCPDPGGNHRQRGLRADVGLVYLLFAGFLSGVSGFERIRADGAAVRGLCLYGKKALLEALCVGSGRRGDAGAARDIFQGRVGRHGLRGADVCHPV